MENEKNLGGDERPRRSGEPSPVQESQLSHDELIHILGQIKSIDHTSVEIQAINLAIRHVVALRELVEALDRDCAYNGCCEPECDHCRRFDAAFAAAEEACGRNNGNC